MRPQQKSHHVFQLHYHGKSYILIGVYQQLHTKQVLEVSE
jgi:hypothetical protein